VCRGRGETSGVGHALAMRWDAEGAKTLECRADAVLERRKLPSALAVRFWMIPPTRP
jgi:hypothetical protein